MSIDNRSRAQWRELYEKAKDDLRHAKRRERAALARLAAAREYVDDPGNWSALDRRRHVLLDLIDGPRCSCGPHALVFDEVPDPGCPFHGDVLATDPGGDQ